MNNRNSNSQNNRGGNGQQPQYMVDGQLMTEQQAQLYYQQLQQMQEQSEEQPHNMFHSLNQQQVLQMYGEQAQNENFENDSESNYDAF